MKTRGLLLAFALGSFAATALTATPEELVRSAFTGDMDAVRRALDSGAEVNAQHAGATALHVGAEHGRLDVVRLLLDRSAHVDALDATEDTPLSWAAAGGHLDVATLLIGKGADVLRARSKEHYVRDEWNPLRWAIMGRHREMVRLLLASGAKPEAVHLAEAVKQHDILNVTSLLDAGASVFPETEDGTSYRVFIAAAESGSVEMLRLLIDRAQAKTQLSAALEKVLHAAAEGGHLPLVQFLLDDMKLNPDSQLREGFGSGSSRLGDTAEEARQGYSPLSRAVENRHEALVKLLLEKGARIAGRTRSGQPLVSFAVTNDRSDLLRLFLNRGAAVDTPDLDDQTALMHAAERGRAADVQLLLAHKAAVQSRNKHGATALGLAARGGHLEIISLLLRHGASATGHTVAGPRDEPRTPLMHAANAGHTAVCQLLARHGADLNEQESKTGQTPLHQAARRRHTETVAALLALGASPALKDSAGRTARDYAVISGDEESAELLRAAMSHAPR